jgi:hypothetical protein
VFYPALLKMDARNEAVQQASSGMEEVEEVDLEEGQMMETDAGQSRPHNVVSFRNRAY